MMCSWTVTSQYEVHETMMQIIDPLINILVRSEMKSSILLVVVRLSLYLISLLQPNLIVLES